MADMEQTVERPADERKQTVPTVPSNPVYERVGEEIKFAAHEGVQRGMTPQDIIKDISARFDVHLNIGELRLLLAGRRVTSDK